MLCYDYVYEKTVYEGLMITDCERTHQGKKKAEGWIIYSKDEACHEGFEANS